MGGRGIGSLPTKENIFLPYILLNISLFHFLRIPHQKLIGSTFLEDPDSTTFFVKKGLNRFEWDFSLPFHTDSLERYKERLEEVAKVLKAEVPGSYYAADSLKGITKSLKKVDSKNVNQLNQVRKRMVSNFGAFSNGKKLFPEKLFFPEAFEGSYRVEVRTGSLKTEGRLEVRNDPNL